jgi:L-alanine-DL-glutamate epimerase-like enolase superfamily enzyme
MAASSAVAAKPKRAFLQSLMPPGAARNALDCALWDFEAKAGGTSVQEMLGAGKSAVLTTAYTLSLGSPDEMAAAARAAAHRPLLKIKVGGGGDIERLRAVVKSAPNSRIILDANEGWTEANLEANMREAAALGIALIEQPLPQGKDAMLRHIERPIPICADESAHSSASLQSLSGLYDAVNIKLDKTGGLTEALKMRDAARALGFKIMAGCMVGTSLAMAPALFLAQGAEFVDLDGPLLLARDREPALQYDGSLVHPPEAALWG